MTRRNEKPEIVRKLVIFSDICSSTALVEDLKATDNLSNWLNLLIRLKQDLISEGKNIGIDMYKFVGDGWILLAPYDIDRNTLFEFLYDFFCCFEIGLDGENINELLSRRPKPMGLTFGSDSGDLIKLEMNEQVEYVGRPLNVAARLQGAAKQFCEPYGAVALLSKSALAQMRENPPGEDMRGILKQVTVPLKHVSGGQEIDCWRWEWA